MKKKEPSLVLRNDVYQSNPLINARKVFDLLGIKIFLLGLRGINPHFSEHDKHYDKEFPDMLIPTGTLTELFGNTWYLGELKEACQKLLDTIIELNRDDGSLTLCHLFDKLDYEPGEGLSLKFSRHIRPYILDLFKSKGYTQIHVEYLFKLSSPYAVRLLELLLQYQNIKLFKELMEIKRKMTVEELRFALNVPEGAYTNRMDNFKKFVLDTPIKELNARTPYIVHYKTVKKGRNVVAFEFTMDTYNVPKNNEDNSKFNRESDAVKVLCAMGFTERIARLIFSKCLDEADCFSRINRAQAVLARNKRPIINKLGFLRKAIEEDWQVGREKARSSEQTETATKSPNQETVSDSMTPIGEILNSIIPKPKESSKPERPQPISVGRKKIPHTLAKSCIDYIRKGEMIEKVKDFLDYYGTTIEKFTQICEKNGL